MEMGIHYLVSDGWDDPYVQHPDDCNRMSEDWFNGLMYHYYPDCPVDEELRHAGFDSLVDQFDEWPPAGRFVIEFWSDSFYVPFEGMEYESGLRLVK